MDIYNETHIGAIAPAETRDIDGHALARSLRKTGVTARAVLAHELESGSVKLSNLTRSQAATVTKVQSDTSAPLPTFRSKIATRSNAVLRVCLSSIGSDGRSATTLSSSLYAALVPIAS